jgi:hypothetical protein
MSTKTNFKRVALVAVAALGLGVLTSVAPASAGNSDASEAANLTATAAAAGVNTTGVCAAGTPTAAATPSTISVGGTQSFALATNGQAVITITGPANWATTASGVTYDSTRQVATTTTTQAALVLTVTGVGAIQVAHQAAVGGSVLQTFYITAVASCTSGASVANSHVQVTDSSTNIDRAEDWIARQINTTTDAAAFLATTNQSTTNMDTSLDVRTLFANDASAYIAIEANDAYKNAIGGSTNLLVVSCDNAARVAGTKFPFYSASNFTGNTDSAGAIQVQQPVSGVAATVTCTVSVNGVLLSTKVIKFAGDLATITIAPSRIGDVATANSGRFTYEAKDAAGNRLTAALGTSDSHVLGTLVSNITLTTGAGGTTLGSFAEVTVAAASGYHGQSYGAGSNPYVSGKGYATFNCFDYGKKDITVYAFNAAGVKVTSNATELTCEDAVIDTYTASLDKASYKQGDVATLTITAKGSGGNVTAYGTTPGTGYSVAMPGMTAVTAPTTADAETTARTGTWVYTYTVNVGAEGAYNGAVKIAVGSTSAQYNKALTVPYTIATSGAVSNADVLKAIVSLIASINKQIAALQKALLKK